MLKILLLEDDKILSEMITGYFAENGFLVETCLNAKKAAEMAYKNSYDAMILDVKVFGGDGFEALKEIRSSGIGIPAIFATSLRTLEDLQAGFDAVCDDFIKKPYELKELLIRVKSLIKRKYSHINDDFVVVGECKFNVHSGELYKDNEKIHLSIKESKLLSLFLQNKNKIISKETIMEALWGYDEEPSELSLRTYIKNIRSIIKKDCIVLKRGIGYMYEE